MPRSLHVTCCEGINRLCDGQRVSSSFEPSLPRLLPPPRPVPLDAVRDSRALPNISSVSSLELPGSDVEEDPASSGGSGSPASRIYRPIFGLVNVRREEGCLAGFLARVLASAFVGGFFLFCD